MDLFGLLIVSPLWGPASTWLFFRGWLAFLGVVSCFFGLAKSGADRAGVMRLLFEHVTMAAFCFTVLAAGFVILYRILGFGETMGQVLVYWLTAIIALTILLPRLGTMIDRLWRDANGGD
jgi:hypothetical protein